MKPIVAIAFLVFAANCFAQDKRDSEGPCKEIKEACEKAGFVKGEAKEGYGL